MRNTDRNIASDLRRLREQVPEPTEEQNERIMKGIATGLERQGRADVTAGTRRHARQPFHWGPWLAGAAAVLIILVGSWAWQANRPGDGKQQSGQGKITRPGPAQPTQLPGGGPIHMVSANTGFAVAPNGNVLRTADAGNTWMPIFSFGRLSGAQLNNQTSSIDPRINDAVQLYAESSNNLWITAPVKQNRQLEVLRSTDGGETVQRVSTITPKVPKSALDKGTPDAIAYAEVVAGQPQFVNANDGTVLISWMGALGMMGRSLYHTIDGGRSWHLVNQDIDKVFSNGSRVQWVTDLSFRTPQDGWMTARMFPAALSSGSSPVWLPFQYTTDGGKTWSSVKLPLPAGYGDRVFGATYGPQFFGQKRENGVLLAGVSSPKQHVLVFTTSNGGKTWTMTSGFPSDISGLTRMSGNTSGSTPTFDLFDMRHWFVTSTDGKTLYFTDDGGEKWQTVHPNISLKGAKLDFVTTMSGLAETSQGVWRTTDGGRIWTVASGWNGTGSQ